MRISDAARQASAHSRPPVAHGAVRRPRLLELLDRAADAPVTVVSAPAGSGKTVLVASWLEQAVLPGPVAWVSVERPERDALRFWAVVLAALRAAGVGTRSMLSPAPRAGSGEVVRRLGDVLDELAAPVVLVLDDLHQLEAQEALDGLAALIARRPAQLRLVLITRRDPHLRLHRLRLAEQLVEIRGGDLAFTPGEAQELIAYAGIEMSPEAVLRLHRRTEGWAAGLRLAALSLSGHADPDRFVAEFSGSERTVAGYLMGEVLRGHDPAVRHLLRRTCVLDRVNGPLADLLTGRPDRRRMLRELEESGAFVESIDVSRSWFRYHPLLADFLRDLLSRESPGEARELHRTAARWYADHGFAVDAIRQAQAGEDWCHAADLLMDHWCSLWLDGERATLHELLMALPVEMVRADAQLAALVALDRLGDARLADADAYSALAERLAASVPGSRRRRLAVTLAVAALLRARTLGDFDAAVDGAQAILDPPDGAAPAENLPNEDLRAMALMNLGIVELWARRLDEAESHLEEGIALAWRIQRPYVALSCLGPLAEVAWMRGRPDAAKAHARAAIELAERLACADGPLAGVAYSALGGMLYAEGYLGDSERWLERADRALHGLYDVEARVVLRFRLGNLRLAQGRYADALACFREAQRADQALLTPHYLTDLTATQQLRALIRLGDIAAARRELSEAGDAAREVAAWRTVAAEMHLAGDEPRRALRALAPVLDGSAVKLHASQEGEALFLAAVAHDRLGKRGESGDALERALGIAETYRWYVFPRMYPGVLPLLERVRPDETAHWGFVAEVLARAGAGALTGPGVKVAEQAELSQRELEILRLLTTQLSAAEIASELLLSVHTVKTHMRRIYGKLGVHRRTDAVETARALGLLRRPVRIA